MEVEPQSETGSTYLAAEDRARTTSHDVNEMDPPQALRSSGWMMQKLEEDLQVVHNDSRFVLREHHPMRICWSTLIILMLVYTGTMFPYRLAYIDFHIDPESKADNTTTIAPSVDSGWDTFDNVVTGVFLADLVANFFFSYKDIFGREVDSLRLIVKHYLKGPFWLDLIACIPEKLVYEVILAVGSTDRVPNNLNQGARQLRLQRIARLARLVRLTRLAKLKSQSKNSFVQCMQELKGVRIINLALGLVWIVHILGCGWYVCAAMHEDPSNTWVARRIVDSSGDSLIDASAFEQWMTSMYFVLTVVTTVGFGDIAAVTTGEIAYVCFTMGIGAVVHSIIISEVINVATSNDKTHQFVKQQSKLVEAFAEHTELDEAAREAMNSWISLSARLRASHYYDKEDMKQLMTGMYLPRSLLGTLSNSVYGGALMRNKMFSKCGEVDDLPPRLLLLVALAVHKSEFQAGEILYQVNEFPFNAFFVVRGTFACIAQPSPQGGRVWIPPPPVWIPKLEESKDSGMQQKPSMQFMRIASTHFRKPRRSLRLQPPEQPLGPKLFPFQLFSAGAYFGHVELITGQPRQATVRAESGSVALSLHKNDLKQLLGEFPNFGARWTSAAHYHAAIRVRRQAKLTRGYSYRHLAAVTIQTFWLRRKASADKESTPEGWIRKSQALRTGLALEEQGPDGGRQDFDLREEVQELRGTVKDMQRDFTDFLQIFRSSLMQDHAYI